MEERESGARDERETFLRVWQRVTQGREQVPAVVTKVPETGAERSVQAGEEGAFLRIALGELERWRGLCCRWRSLCALDCPMARLQRRLAARLYLSTGEQIPLRRVLPQGDMDERTACRVLYGRLRQGEAAFRGRGGTLGEEAAQVCAAWAQAVERRVAQIL